MPDTLLKKIKLLHYGNPCDKLSAFSSRAMDDMTEKMDVFWLGSFDERVISSGCVVWTRLGSFAIKRLRMP